MSERFDPRNRYAPRDVHALGIATLGAWSIKRYGITLPGAAIDPHRFTVPEAALPRELPDPPITTHRPGVGFTIAHQGAGADYFVACWWDRDNELPMRIWVSAPGRDAGEWSKARGAESVCIWDLGIVWFERDVYVRTMVGPNPPDRGAYLDAWRPTPV